MKTYQGQYVYHPIDKAAFFKVLYNGIKVSVLQKIDNLSNKNGHIVITNNKDIAKDYI